MEASQRKYRIIPILASSVILLHGLLLGGAIIAHAGSSNPGTGEYQAGAFPPDTDGVPPVPPSEKRTGKNAKMDSHLNEISVAAEDSIAAALRLAESRSAELIGKRIQVHIFVEAGDQEEVTALISGLGGDVTGGSIRGDVLQAWVPVVSLEALAESERVLKIRQPESASLLENLAAGFSSTEALSVMNATSWHAAGYDGTGVKVGVVDAGFMGYPGLLGTDLPSSVTVKNFVDWESDLLVDGGTEHGTACAEIVHDIAPGAELFLVKVSTDIDLQEAVMWLQDTQNVDVITTSLGWYNVTPGDGTGFFAELASGARSDGIFWATAAGNDRLAHWGGQYNAGEDGFHDFDGDDQVVNYFGPGNGDAYSISSDMLISIYLRWDDWGLSDQDYDLYLLRWSGSDWQIVAWSEDFQSGGPADRPTEAIHYVTVGGSSFYGIAIHEWDSDRAVNFELFAPKVDRLDEIVTSRSLVNLADAPAAITVAALDIDDPYPQEHYSSEGPTNGPGGTEAGGDPKPDISGFANISTESYGPGEFNGTSAATPHVAGAAALVAELCPTCTPDQIEALLEYRAIDMGPAGMDNQFGHGRLSLGDPVLFSDVSLGYWAMEWIEALFQSGITSGCTAEPPLYCPEDSVTRAQMAIFLERGMRGADYTPVEADGTVFADVSADHWAAAWIEQLASDGITAGCGNGNYCPEAPVTRAQMAVFLERAMSWPAAAAVPPASGTVFSDVPADYWAAAWIEQLHADGITGGCSAEPAMYCPDSAVTRAQMAVFLVRAFGLPMP